MVVPELERIGVTGAAGTLPRDGGGSCAGADDAGQRPISLITLGHGTSAVGQKPQERLLLRRNGDSPSSSRSNEAGFIAVPLAVNEKTSASVSGFLASFTIVIDPSLVFSKVQVGVSPAATVTLTELSPGSKSAVSPSSNAPPWPVPIRMTAPLAVQLMSVRT